MADGFIALSWEAARSAARRGPGGCVGAPRYCVVLAAVGIMRELRSCEAIATRDSVEMALRGTLRWRVAKNVMKVTGRYM